MFCEIISGLFICDSKSSLNEYFFKKYNITIVFNCTENNPFIHLTNIEKIRVPLSFDMKYETDVVSLKKYLPKLCTLIKNNLFEKNMLICCYDGLKISPLIIALFIMKEANIPKIDIHNILTSKYKDICLDYNLDIFLE
jgi:hypothetical protein